MDSHSHTTGAWKAVDINKDNINVLLRALYPLRHIRVRIVVECSQQVVAGMNYRFIIQGSDLKINARDTRFAIRIFEQPWTNTLRVDSIEQL